jgi:uncharacterized membrane protein
MDELGLVLLGLLIALAFPVVAIIALVVALNARAEARLLSKRLDALDLRWPVAPPSSQAAASTPPPSAAAAKAPISASAPPQPTPELPIAPPPTPSMPPPQPPAAAPAALPSSATLEERFGTQWVVWIGGLALALGAIFLVRYTIEQGLLGPGVRIILAALFAAMLIVAGEWTRRQEISVGFIPIATRHIPSILTAAGTIAAYSTAYAAYVLYEFIGSGAAFVLLGIVALATLTAALLHGPALAGLGLVGAFVAPLLVSSETPNYWALYIYLFVVTAATFALARTRLWRWLAISAVVFSVAYALPGAAYQHVDALGAHLFQVAAGFALAAAMIVSGLFYGPPAERGAIEPISSGALAAYLLAGTVLVVDSAHDQAALAVFTLLAAATVAICWRTDAGLWALPAAGLLCGMVMWHWAAPDVFDPLLMPPGPTRGAIPDLSTGVGPHIALGAAFAALFGGAGYAAQLRTPRLRIALVWSGTSVAAPIAVLIALYARIAHYDQSVPFAGLALLAAALYGYAADQLSRRDESAGIFSATAVFATGAIAALALALTFALEKGWLTVALALTVPGIAWINSKRPLAALRYLAAGMVAVVLLRIVYEPRIVGGDVGTTPIFNWLLYGYGVPAASFWYAGYLMRRRADDAPARITDAAAILFTVLLAFLEIRHYMTGGNLYAPTSALAEIALQVAIGLAMTIGLERLRMRSHSVVHDIGALAIGALTLAAILIGLMLEVNPLRWPTTTGGPLFNLILLGYGMPALLAGILAVTTRGTRPLAYRYVVAATAVLLSLLYLMLEVRRLFHGSRLSPLLPTFDAEQYTYSAVWLVFGVALLVVGFFLRSQPARLASAAVVTITIGKVFLVDLAGLTGIFRALSFIGLGVVLVGIGWVYQRLLFPSRGPAITKPANEPG